MNPAKIGFDIGENYVGPALDKLINGKGTRLVDQSVPIRDIGNFFTNDRRLVGASQNARIYPKKAVLWSVAFLKLIMRQI